MYGTYQYSDTLNNRIVSLYFNLNLCVLIKNNIFRNSFKIAKIVCNTQVILEYILYSLNFYWVIFGEGCT